jgi:ribonuclease Z
MQYNIKKYLKYKLKIMYGTGPKKQQPYIFKEITFLGTNSGMPTKYRNVSSNCLSFLNGEIWMFDCGEATQNQILKSQNISIGNIEKIFITHLHGDHLYGLPGLMSTISSLKSGEKYSDDCIRGKIPDFSSNSKYFEIYGPYNLAKYLRQVFETSQTCLNYKYRVNEIIPKSINRDFLLSQKIKLYHNEEPPNYIFINPDNTYDIIKSENDITPDIKASILQHPIFSLGYVIIEPNLVGTLDLDKAVSLGVPRGPLLGKLKNGEEITLKNKDGVEITVKPEEVLGPTIIGRKMTILGDTCDSRYMINISMNSDFLVHESTLSRQDTTELQALQRGHSTAYMAGKFAGMINAKNLILTHFGSKFEPRDKDEKEIKDMDLLINEAYNGYQEVNLNIPNIITAEDLFVFNLRRE